MEGVRKIPKNLYVLDLAKFIAAIIVVYGHTEALKVIAPMANFLIINFSARFVIPFFLMASGYLFYSKYLNDQSRSKVLSKYGLKYLKHLLTLYASWSIVYFPFMVDQLLSLHTTNLRFVLYGLRSILYLGTAHHMWYFTALIFSVLILDLWISRFQLRSLLIISAIFYGIGLLGDSYFGLIPQGSIAYTAFKLYFHIFESTRNGLFFGLFFVTLGAYLYENPLKLSLKRSAQLSMSFFALLGLEVWLLTNYSHPRDYDFMLMNVPLGLFLFHTLINLKLSWNLNYKLLRKLSTLIYCSHVVFIISVTAVLTHLNIGLSEASWMLFPLTLGSTLLFFLFIIKLEDFKSLGYITSRLQ